MKGLNSKRVFITGAASGIGRSTAERFYDEKSELILIDRCDEKESELKSRFPERMTYIQADISKSVDLPSIFAEMNKGVDVLINNAGITRDASFLKMSRQQWDEVMAVNLTAIFALCQGAAQQMKTQKSGCILNATSVVAHYGSFGQANYVASKAGLIGFTKTLAKELGRYNIRVNAVAPGFIATPMALKVPEEILTTLKEKTPLQRLGEAYEVANLYAFLASEEAAFITGTVINIDGGLVIG